MGERLLNRGTFRVPEPGLFLPVCRMAESETAMGCLIDFLR